ncbi:YrhB domain-containing protein [Kitasatospora sp. P5_F3]
MISEERAVELVESLLARERLTWASTGPLPELTVTEVQEHVVGWLVFWNSAEYARTRDVGDALVGSGPYLVDRQDGSIHHVPAPTWAAEDWEQLYLQEIEGARPLDSSIRALLDSAGVIPAIKHLRKQVTPLNLRQAVEYSDAGEEDFGQEIATAEDASAARAIAEASIGAGPTMV